MRDPQSVGTGTTGSEPAMASPLSDWACYEYRGWVSFIHSTKVLNSIRP